MSAEREHALLSASSAHRWLICTPSARFEETLPEITSEYAEEGRLAHEIAELYARKAFIEPMTARKFNTALKKLQADELYQKEMLTHAETYVEKLSEIVHSFKSKPHVVLERRVDYAAYAPEGFGTADCIIIGDETMYVVDYKYGKGVPVDATDNPQMMLYGLGALQEYAFLYNIKSVHLTIVQPRLDNNAAYRLAAEDLIAWGQKIKPLAQSAFGGIGDYIPGEHCRFCRAKAVCRARAAQNTALEDFQNCAPADLSNAEIGQLLIRAKDLVSWAKDLEDYALSRCLSGEEIPGWKAVEGRAVRAFTDQEEAFKQLVSNGVEEALLYERKPLTLASIEKVVGKSLFYDLLSDFIVTPPGKPTLVEEKDKRQAITRIGAEEDFK
ncbi:MAG: DUF2800 domain-containing protein [Eubacteriales bacterium]|jgi:hypothetical protein